VLYNSPDNDELQELITELEVQAPEGPNTTRSVERHPRPLRSFLRSPSAANLYAEAVISARLISISNLRPRTTPSNEHRMLRRPG
jgi:hypothetical protein